MLRILAVAAALLCQAPLALAGGKTVSGPLDFKVKTIDGKELDLATFKGKAVLLVNVASECGYTPQYKGLQELHKKYASPFYLKAKKDLGITNDRIPQLTEVPYPVQMEPHLVVEFYSR